MCSENSPHGVSAQTAWLCSHVASFAVTAICCVSVRCCKTRPSLRCSCQLCVCVLICVQGWGNDVMAATERIEVVFESCSKELDTYGRKREDDKTRFASFGVDFDWDTLRNVKEKTVGLAKR